MEMLSNEYGWIPSQISNERVDILEGYLEIINTRRLINSKKHG